MFIKNKGNSALIRVFLFCIIFSFSAVALYARGSGEFSKKYQDELTITFEEVVLQVESGTMDEGEAKQTLSLLRTEYNVEYNDFAGKLDAIIDEVAENKKDSQEALSDFSLLQEDLVRVREQKMEQNREQNKVKTVNKSILINNGQGSPHGGTSSAGKDRTGKNN